MIKLKSSIIKCSAVFLVFKIIPALHINDRLTHIKYELNCNLLIFAKSKPQQ